MKTEKPYYFLIGIDTHIEHNQDYEHIWGDFNRNLVEFEKQAENDYKKMKIVKVATGSHDELIAILRAANKREAV